MKYLKFIDKYNITLEGKTYIVTGANSGIGFETCRYLRYLKANIILACRNLDKAKIALNKLKEEIDNSGSLTIIQYDQASLSSIESFANQISNIKIDGLICNAGVYYPKKDYKTIDGYPLTIGTNYIGQCYLVHLLKDKLINNNARLVLVNSITAILSKNIDFSKMDKLSRNSQYGYSKLLVSQEAYELCKENEIETILVHPGICSTNILDSKDTGLSSTFALLGRKFLNIFTHSASKAALSVIDGLLCEYKSFLYIKPRGLFAISGYPTRRKMPNKFKSEGLIDKTINLIKENKIC